MTIIPDPPGAAATIDRPVIKRFATPDLAANFIVGIFERGTVAQITTPTGLQKFFGDRVNYSPAYDEVIAQLVSGSKTTTIARVVGPAAVNATKAFTGASSAPSIQVTAASAGDWGNRVKAEIKAPTTPTGSRQIVVTLDDIPVATSPAFLTVADMVAWTADASESDAKLYVKVTANGTALPSVIAATALLGGTDDRANITPTQWAAALAKLDRRYGPGVLRAPGVHDPTIQLAMIDHCAQVPGRMAFLDAADDATEADTLSQRQSLRDSRTATCWKASLWQGDADATLISGEPIRRIPGAAAQAGVQSKVLRGPNGVGLPAFGPRRGRLAILSRLATDRSTGTNPSGAVQRLYQGYVNTFVDRGSSIHSEGYRTLDPDPRREDLHVAFTLAWLEWKGFELALSYIGEPVDRDTLAAYHADITGICNTLITARAIRAEFGDAGYVVDVDGVNDIDSMARRELHGFVRIRPTGSVHWTDITVGTVAANERLLAA